MKKEHEIRKIVIDALEKGIVKRAWITLVILGCAHLVWGLPSYNFIKIFRTDVTIFDNTWPRWLFNALPLFLSAIFIRYSKRSAKFKIHLFSFSFSVIFFLAACIYVWPTALSGKPEILLYVGGVNTAYFIATWSVVALDLRNAFRSFLYAFIFIIAPLLYVCSKSGNPNISMTVINDMLFAIFAGIGCGLAVSKVYEELEVFRATQEVESSSFLSEPIKKAIFEGKKDLLNEKTVNCFVALFDIRNSTSLTKKYGSRWADFNRTWLSKVNSIVHGNGFHIIKTTGDGLLVVFGLFDDDPLVDLDHLSEERSRAEEVRFKYLTEKTLACIDEIINSFYICGQQILSEEPLSIGCGLDRGPIIRGIRGDENRMEFDVWGDRVNTSAKLEAFCKIIGDPKESIATLLVSPYAADYIEDCTAFTKVDIPKDKSQSIQGITWVLKKEYRRSKQSNAAA